MLGNFPQAFTHLALVDAAQDLAARTRSRRAGETGPTATGPTRRVRPGDPTAAASRSLRAMALVTNVVSGSGVRRGCC